MTTALVDGILVAAGASGSVGVWPPSWLDLALAVLFLVYAASGFRAGLLVSASSLVGFVAGGALALWALPRATSLWSGWAEISSAGQWLILLAVLLLAAGLGQVIGHRIGVGLRKGLRWRPGQFVDASAGALLVVAMTAGIVWFLAGAARLSGSPTLSAIVGRSSVLAAIDRTVPVPVGSVLTTMGGVLSGHGFPQVFEGVAHEPIVAVPAPDPGALGSGVAAAAASVVRIDGQAPSCSRQLEGSGWVTSPGVVVTNAHVVAGTASVTVREPGRGVERTASVVLFDPARDIAVLRVPGLRAPALTLGGVLDRDSSAAALGYPLAGPYAVEPARVRDRLTARGRDIYGAAEVSREVYSLRAVVQPGNSGGPLVDAEGRVVGVVFARSLDDAETGYALTLAEVADDLTAAAGATHPMPTGACLTGR
ncbi:MAG TPA: MarP family serine protease [Phycicoccus sp.]|nr:MarP family serine protease [Phycicoccus sp.]